MKNIYKVLQISLDFDMKISNCIYFPVIYDVIKTTNLSVYDFSYIVHTVYNSKVCIKIILKVATFVYKIKLTGVCFSKMKIAKLIT